MFSKKLGDEMSNGVELLNVRFRACFCSEGNASPTKNTRKNIYIYTYIYIYIIYYIYIKKKNICCSINLTP